MQVSSMAGSGNKGWGDGQGTEAHFNSPCCVAVDWEGNIIVADSEGNRIRKIEAGLVPPLSAVLAVHAELPSVHVSRMEALLRDESQSDVIFVVGHTRIHAHRCILQAQSEYFGAMLSSGFREGQEPPCKRAKTSGQEAATEITIGDTTPEAFRALLRYLYTDELRFEEEELLDVMRKAKEISLDRVYNHTVRRVRMGMSVRMMMMMCMSTLHSDLT